MRAKLYPKPLSFLHERVTKIDTSFRIYDINIICRITKSPDSNKLVRSYVFIMQMYGGAKTDA